MIIKLHTHNLKARRSVRANCICCLIEERGNVQESERGYVRAVYVEINSAKM